MARNLADQLIAGQISRLDSGKHIQPCELLAVTRGHASRNVLQASLSDVAVPAGVSRASPRYVDGQRTSRALYGETCPVDRVTAIVVGGQFADKSMTWLLAHNEVASGRKVWKPEDPSGRMSIPP